MGMKKLIQQTEDIHQATELISSKLKKPVIIENNNFELVSYSSSFADFDPTQQKTILSKKCPIFIIERLKKEGVVQRLDEQPGPIRLPHIEELGFQERVVIAVRHLEHTMGYLWVQESEKSLDKEELGFLVEVRPHLGKLIFDQYTKITAKEGRKEELLWELLNHEYRSESQFRHDASLAKLQLPGRFSVIVFSVTAPQFNYLLDDLENTLRRFRNDNDLYFLKTDFQVIILIKGLTYKRLSSRNLAYELIEEVKLETGKRNFYQFLIGIGKEYTKLFYMRKSFLEALEVIETANFISPRPESMPRELSNLGVYRYLAVLYEKNSSKDYYNEDLLTLIRKDTEKQTELLLTLEAYLANNGQGKQTAKDLSIHPNTLNYRIRKIQELTNIDFSDFNMKAYLYTELLLLNNVEGYDQRYKSTL